MAIIKFINNNATLKTSLNYVMKEEKTEKKLISGKDCIAENSLNEMIATKKQFKKYQKGRDKIHFIQSFSPNDNLTYELAHEIGLKMAEHFKGFQVVVATHIDKKHLHNHLIINSVNFENGKKFQQSKADLAEIKKLSNDLCIKYGLTITDEKAKVDDIKINELKSRQKNESWKYQLEKDIITCMEKSNNKFEFFREINSLGYKVTWTKERKNITYTTPEGKKCRDRKLHQEIFLKENMEKYFKEKSIKKFKTIKENKKYYANSLTHILIHLLKQKEDEYFEALYKNNIEYGTNAKKEYARKMSYSSEELEM